VPAWITLAIAMAAALAMRLWALRFQALVTVDGTEYIRFAEALARGVPFASIFPPGYPALIALAHVVVPDRVLAAQVVSIACGTLLTVPVWLLARAALGPWWAGVPALAIALHPELARFSAVTMSESAYILLLHAALALVATRRAPFAGLTMGAAFAVRPEALVTAVALAVGAAARALRWKTGWKPLAWGTTGFVILALPCWMYFHATLGEWTLTPKIGALRTTTTDWRVDERRLRTEAREEEPAGALDLLIRNGPAAITQYPANARAHGRSLHELWPVPLLALSLLGLVWRRGIESLPLVTLLLLPLLGLSRQPRFLLAALPALAILATVPLMRARSLGWRATAVALWLAGAIWCGAIWRKPFTIPLDGSFEAHVPAGQWLGSVAEPDAVILDRKPYVSFYSRRTYRVMPDEPYEDLVQYAVSSGARYLVVDQKVSSIFRTQLEPLLYDGAFRDREQRLELVYVGGRVKGYGVGIFRVLRPGETKIGKPPVVEAAYLK
jgi:hypothetical protein